MSRFDKRRLPALMLVAAAMICPSGLILAQSPSANPSDSAQKPASSTAPTTAAAATTSVTLPKTPPTPEQLGDALMAHQRYQAAIDAYKKAPTNDPVVQNKLGIAYQLMFNLVDAMHC